MTERLPTDIELPAHVQAALDEGKLWRAKEILQGRVGSMPYSPALYEQYGAVLLAMDDRMQAGKYLFLSGARRPEYEDAIATFMERHGRRSERQLVASFPANARSLALGRFPPNVRAALLERGVVDRENRPIDTPERRVSAILAGAAMVGCLLAAALAAASMVVGLPIVIGNIADLFR